MSDGTVPEGRKIVGLESRRQVDLSRLVKDKRTAPAPLAIVETTAPAAPAEELPAVQPAAPSAPAPAVKAPKAKAVAKPAPKPRSAAVEQVESPKRSTSIYLTDTARSRGTAAFMATSYIEGDSSWSDFVETAILREAERREKIHNAGAPFVVAHRLSAGRPPRG